MNDQHAFLNRVRSLHNIDRDQLPEFLNEEWSDFSADPVRYLICTNDAQAAAIWREVEKRQKAAPDATADLMEALRTAANAFDEIAERTWDKRHHGECRSACEHASGVASDAREAVQAAISKASSPALQATGGEK